MGETRRMSQDNLYDVEIEEGHSPLNDLFINYLVKQIGEDDFLDVGCNSGYLIEKCGHGHGVDLSGQMVDKARAKGLDVYWGASECLDYKDGEVPVVVLSCILEQTSNPIKTLEEALRVASDRVIGITPMPDQSVWGQIGGTKWVKSVVFPEYLQRVYNSSVSFITPTHYYFEIKKDIK